MPDTAEPLSPWPEDHRSLPDTVRFAEPEVLRSWHRSRRQLGAPELVADVPQVATDSLDLGLVRLLDGPLASFAASVAGTGLAVLLADSRGRILRRWCGDRSAAAHLDRIGTQPGADLSEDAVGTNGVGTVALSGRPLQIQGAEHFAGFYRDAVCTGGPVLDPADGAVLGVVTLSCDLTPRADLLKPLLGSLLQTLNTVVLGDRRASAARTGGAIPLGRGQAPVEIVTTQTRRSDGARGTVLVGTAPSWRAAVHRLASLRTAGRLVVVAGEAGTGKLSLALGRPAAGASDGSVVDAVERTALGEAIWSERVRAALASSPRTALRGIDALDGPGLAVLRAILRAAPACPLVMTMTAETLEDAERVAARFDASVVWAPALRERAEDIEELWRVFAAELASPPGLHLRPGAVEALRTRQWPDNVRSLRALVDGLVARGHRGSVTATDLGGRSGPRPSSMMEEAERETIERAIAAAGGNRARAAELLGLSRATVYRKVKAYRLDV